MLHRAYRFIPDSIAVHDLPFALLLSLTLAYLAACALAELAGRAWRAFPSPARRRENYKKRRFASRAAPAV